MADKKPRTKTTEEAADPLEKDLERLESLVEQLESGEVGLEKSIDLFAEGRRIGQRALKRLDELERRIEIVTGEGADGDLSTEPFDEDQER